MKGEDDEKEQPLDNIDPFKVVTGFKYAGANDRFNAELIAPIPARLQQTMQKWKNCSKAFIIDKKIYENFDIFAFYQSINLTNKKPNECGV